MPEKNKTVVEDLLGNVLSDAVKQQAAGVIMGMVSKFLEGLLSKLFAGKTSNSDEPTLPPGSKPVVPSPDDDEDVPVPSGRIWNGLKLSIKNVKREGVHVHGSVLEAIKLSGGGPNQGDPAVPGDVVNLDLDPLDQAGNEIGPGSPELSQLLVDPQNPYDPAAPNDGSEPRMRIQYAVGGGDFAINGTRWQYACAGNFKVHRNFKGETIAVVSAFGRNAQGKMITSNAVRFRVKG